MVVVGALLTILKILLIIILSIVAIILILIGLILCAPFIYNINVKKFENINGNLFFNWFWGIIKVEVIINDNENEVKVFVFGKDIKERKPKRKKKKKKKLVKEKPITAQEKATEKKAVKKETEVKEETKKEETTPAVKRVNTKRISAEIEVEIKAEELEEKKNTKEKKKEKTKVKKKKAQKDKESTKEKLDAKYFINMPLDEKKEIIKSSFTCVKNIIKTTLPKDVYINGTIGTSDPSTTGYILICASMVQEFLNKNIYIKGHFEGDLIEGEVRLKGKLRFLTFVMEVLKLANKKSVRKIIKLYLKR